MSRKEQISQVSVSETAMRLGWGFLVLWVLTDAAVFAPQWLYHNGDCWRELLRNNNTIISPNLNQLAWGEPKAGGFTIRVADSTCGQESVYTSPESFKEELDGIRYSEDGDVEITFTSIEYDQGGAQVLPIMRTFDETFETN